MMLIDSSVLIDVIEAKDDWKYWSAKQLTKYANEHQLFINVIVYAELAKAFASSDIQNSFLSAARIEIMPISTNAAFLAARAHDAYRAAGGLRSATLPDFFIGAHASTMGYVLLTRDPKRIRTYFPDVNLITPE